MADRLPTQLHELQQYVLMINTKMVQCEKTGKYVEAEELRLKLNEGKKQLQARKFKEMNNQQSKRHQELDTAYEQELKQFNTARDKIFKDFEQQSRKQQVQLSTKHNDQLEKTKAELEKSIPSKHKESSELLNLRKRQEEVVKQKNYPQANKFQTKINQLVKIEAETYNNERVKKIETALNLLKSKQAQQLAALKKKIEASKDELKKSRLKQQQRINLKYKNAKKVLTSQHQKETLSFKGHFKSKVTVGSPITSKSKG